MTKSLAEKEAAARAQSEQEHSIEYSRSPQGRVATCSCGWHTLVSRRTASNPSRTLQISVDAHLRAAVMGMWKADR